MIHKRRGYSNRKVFMRFVMSGIGFTIMGPTIFWITYPLGAMVAVAVSELLVHSMRFATYRSWVFPANMGYRVNLPRYIISALPISLTGLVAVALLAHKLDRITLTLSAPVIALCAGFIWSRYIYTIPVAERQ
jgi:putative flippase GtrA